MTSPSNELQAAMYRRAVAFPAVHAVVEDRIYDRVPENPTFPYVTFGTSDVAEDDAECITGSVETMQVNGWSRYQGGTREVKDLAFALKNAFHLYSTDLGTHALHEMRVTGIRYFDDPDGITTQAAITVQAIIEEN